MTTLSGLDPRLFEGEIDGLRTGLFILNNEDGMEVCITNYGARLVSWMVPDKNGVMDDVVLGFSSLDAYLQAHEVYHGATIGRYANRIANGKFTLDDKEYILNQNNGTNSLHGGPGGFHSKVWEVLSFSDTEIKMHLLSPAGDEGFPGNLDVTLTYALNEAGELSILFEATTDAKTVVNLTHHSFFNLAGEGSGTINDHLLFIEADSYNPVNEDLIPTGIEPVENTPFDFREMRPIGSLLDTHHEQFEKAGGYDHNFVLNRFNRDRINWVAEVRDPKSGRSMKVFTNEPGLQFYGGNFLDGSDKGKSGKPYKKRTAFCLETQHFPNSPNNENFPSVVLYPGQMYKSACIYKFGGE